MAGATGHRPRRSLRSMGPDGPPGAPMAAPDMAATRPSNTVKSSNAFGAAAKAGTGPAISAINARFFKITSIRLVHSTHQQQLCHLRIAE